MSDDGPPDQPSPERPRIIRRHPTGPLPSMDDTSTSYIGRPEEAQAETGYIPRARPVAIAPSEAAHAGPAAAVTTAVLSIISGWATAVIATDLITGWWRSDPLFCVAVGFLAAVSAAGLVVGLIQLLLRRRLGRWLIVVGSVIGLMIFASLFVAGAKLDPVVYTIPVLPLITMVLALLPATRRWCTA